MKWIDTREIAIALAEAHPGVDPATVRFTELREWVMRLEGGKVREGTAYLDTELITQLWN